MDLGSAVAIGCLIAFGIVALVGALFAVYYTVENKNKSAKLRQVNDQRRAEGLKQWGQSESEDQPRPPGG